MKYKYTAEKDLFITAISIYHESWLPYLDVKVMVKNIPLISIGFCTGDLIHLHLPIVLQKGETIYISKKQMKRYNMTAFFMHETRKGDTITIHHFTIGTSSNFQIG